MVKIKMIKKFFDLSSQEGAVNVCFNKMLEGRPAQDFILCGRKDLEYELFPNGYYKTLCKCKYEVWIYSGYLEDVGLQD